MAQTTNKQFIYRVYQNGAYKGTWNDVVTDFTYSQQINSAGSAVTVRLARPADNYNEGGDVDFNNTIKVYVVDDESPNGTLIFQGFIVNYKPIYGDQEFVEVTIMGFGATFEDYMIETGEITDVNQNSQNANFVQVTGGNNKAGSFDVAVQSFTVGAGITKLSAVEFWIGANNIADVGNSVILRLYTSQADSEGTGLSSVVGTVTLPITSTTAGAYKFTFGTPLTVTPGSVLYPRLTYSATDHDPGGVGIPGYSGAMNVYYDSTAPYSGGALRTVNFNGVSWQAAVLISGDAYIKTYSSSGNTQSPYASTDPSAILRSIIDNYRAQGGAISYTAASIDNTNTSVTYQFNTNTVLEGVNKCLELAPVGWYWYIDQANNVLHFHKRASTATHKMVLGKHIRNLSVDKRIQELVNIVYFVGGLVSGSNLFRKYILQSSVDLYGRRAIRISDNNVTNTDTAQVIANSYLSDQSQVALRIDMDIVDNGGQASSLLGFDLESITLGEMMSFKGFGAGTGGSQWDVALWDFAKWDFDVTDLNSVVVQVTQVDYKPDLMHLSLSTVPPDVTKRIEDLRRNIDQLNVVNNPAAPS